MVLHVDFPWWLTKGKVGLFTWLSEWKVMWKIWDLRAFILLSLALQALLIFLAPFRKRTANTLVIISVWLAYLMADYVAIQAVGLIPKYNSKTTLATSAPHDDVLAFWAPFLLVHLGGPDPITALALEDNELWMRTGLHLFTYAAATGRVFFQSLPQNILSIPTVFMFFVGILKYLERTLSLYYARLTQFKTSMLAEPDPGPNYAKLMESYDSYLHSALPARFDTNPEPEQYNDINDDNNNGNEGNSNAVEPGQDNVVVQPAQTDISTWKWLRSFFPGSKVNATEVPKEVRLRNVMLVRQAFEFFELYKGLYVDLIFSFHDRRKSRAYFLNPKLSAKDAFTILEIELNFTYEAFYTKMIVIHKTFGTSIRSISFTLQVVCLLIWILFIDKNPYRALDIWITYTLLVGAIVIDAISFVMAVISDWQLAMLNKESEKRALLYEILLSARGRNWGEHWGRKGSTFLERIRRVMFRRWSESVFQFNLIHYCVHRWSLWAAILVKVPPIKDKLEGFQLVSKKWFHDEFRDFIFGEIRYKAEIAEEPKDAEEICESKGDWVLRSLAGLHFEPFTFYPWTVDVEYDECLLLWHIATELLYQEEKEKKKEKEEKEKKKAASPQSAASGDAPSQLAAGGDAPSQSAASGDASSQSAAAGGDAPSQSAAGDDVPNPEREELDKKYRKYSKTLSDYMMYLLSRQQVMMSGVAGISEVRFRDTCAEANIFFDRVLPKSKRSESTKTRIRTACKRMMDVNTSTKPKDIKGDRSKSVLFDGVLLAKQLKEVTKNPDAGVGLWELIAKVWVELLSYSATHTRASVHAAQLRKGGELLTLIWLLMVHVGLAPQFKINQGNARSKLIISK